MRESNARLSKQQRRKRRRIRRICVTVFLVILAVVILMTGLRLRTLSAFSGEYTRYIDITDRVVSNIAVWLSDVEGAQVDSEWVRSRTEDMIVSTELSFNPKGLKRGSYTEELNNPSYGECEDRAYLLTADCLRELIIKRLSLIGYADSLTDEEADALVKEALGMSLDSYIKNAGIHFMPDYNELTGEVTRTGDYRIRGNSITWERDGQEATDEFRRGRDSLIIVEPGYIYSKSIK